MAKKNDPASEMSAEQFNDKFIKNTEHHLKDKIYNFLIYRYSLHNHKFMPSDVFVWTGAVYVIPEIIGYLIWFTLFMWFGTNILYKKYGEVHVFVFFMLFLIWRVNTQTKLLRQISKK